MTTLDLISSKYNLAVETNKLKQLMFEVQMFSKSAYMGIGGTQTFTYSNVFDELLFRDWKHRKTCINLKDFLVQADADFDAKVKIKGKEQEAAFNQSMLRFVECINNVLFFKPNFDYLESQYSIRINEKMYKYMLEILSTFLEKTNCDEITGANGWISLVQKNTLSDLAIANCKSDLQWEIVKYRFLGKNLSEKRKQLAFMATELYIEQDATEKGYLPFDVLMRECTMILNNLHIRHNNLTGKWENEVAKNLTEKEALVWCDRLYEKILLVSVIREQLKYRLDIDTLAAALKKK